MTFLHHSDRLSNQLRSQQQVIEQQHSDYEVLACSETRARKELAAVTHDLEVANKNLKKYFEAEYDHQVMVSVFSHHWVSELPDKSRSAVLCTCLCITILGIIFDN